MIIFKKDVKVKMVINNILEKKMHNNFIKKTTNKLTVNKIITGCL